MSLTIEDLSPTVVKLVLQGRLDSLSVAPLELPFTAAASGSGKHVLVDLSQVTFCASLALRMVIASARVVQRRGQHMVLFGAQPPVAEVMETVAMSKLMPIVQTQAEAQALLTA